MRSLIFLAIMGCIGCATTVPRVEVAQPLPVSHSNNEVLTQVHYYTPDDFKEEIYNLNLQYQKLAEDMNNYRWFYYPGLMEELSIITHQLVDRMNSAKNVEEYIFYHRLYVRCVEMVNEFKEFDENEEWKYKAIFRDFKRGVP